MEDINKIPFFFIVGRPRSGTTLLRTLFDAHPNVNIPSESQFIIDLYPKYGKITNWTEKTIISFYNDLLTQWLFDTWAMDYQELKANLLKCKGENTYSTITKVVYSQYVSFFKKDKILFFGDKNPGYTIYTKRLLKIFPEAKFIHIVRDYRDNFVSIKNVDFELPAPALVVQKWKYFFNKFNKDSEIKPDAYYVLKYEDLVTDPELQLKKLCKFLELKYDNKVLNFYEKKEEALKTYSPKFMHKYQSSLMQKINTNKIGVWKTQLSPWQIRLMDATVGKTGSEAGYEKKYNDFDLWITIYAVPGKLYANALNVATNIVDKFPYKLRMNILSKGPLFLAKVYLSIFNPKKLNGMKDMMVKKN